MSLVVEGLSVRYGTVRAVRTVSLSCEFGRIVTLVGPNGAGKSSVLTAIAGASEGTVTGSVSIGGVDLVGLKPERIVSEGLALVPEGRRIFNSLSVDENLRIGTVVRSDRRAAQSDVEASYERFPALARRRTSAGGSLSGGEAQQLAIARALVSRPRFLLLDEPSLGLAPLVVEQIFEIIGDLRDEGLGIILVEQNAIAAMELADTTFLMLSGELRGSTNEISNEQLASEYFSSSLDPNKGAH